MFNFLDQIEGACEGLFPSRIGEFIFSNLIKKMSLEWCLLLSVGIPSAAVSIVAAAIVFYAIMGIVTIPVLIFHGIASLMPLHEATRRQRAAMRCDAMRLELRTKETVILARLAKYADQHNVARADRCRAKLAEVRSELDTLPAQ